jgi:hypothetical protein
MARNFFWMWKKISLCMEYSYDLTKIFINIFHPTHLFMFTCSLFTLTYSCHNTLWKYQLQMRLRWNLGLWKNWTSKMNDLLFKTKLNGVKSSVNIFTWMKEGLPWGWHVTQFKIKTPMKMCFSFMIILF